MRGNVVWWGMWDLWWERWMRNGTTYYDTSNRSSHVRHQRAIWREHGWRVRLISLAASMDSAVGMVRVRVKV